MADQKKGPRNTLHTREHRALISVVTAARKERGFTQLTLADRVAELFNVTASRSWLGKFEAGERGLDAVEVMWLERALDYGPGTLIALASQWLEKTSGASD